MGQKFVTVDGNDVVQEPYDEDNGNVPVGALPITDAELGQLQQGFNMFKHVGGVLVPNEVAEEARLKKELIAIERDKAIEALITPKRAQIEAMPIAALRTARAAGGI